MTRKAFIFFALTLAISSCTVKKTPETNNNQVQAISAQSEAWTATNSGEIIQTINARQFNALINSNNVQLVDVRTPDEFATGHLHDAVNLDYNQEAFKAEITKLNKNEPVYVYCRSGKRSAGAAEILKDAGFSKIMNLEGGILAWEEAKLPTSK